jgi:mercuric reductase
LIIIGGGAAGFASATKADDLGARALIVNTGLPIGGTCVNVGCIPSKVLLEMAYDFSYGKIPRFESLNYKQSEWINFKKVVEEKDGIIDKIRRITLMWSRHLKLWIMLREELTLNQLTRFL